MKVTLIQENAIHFTTLPEKKSGEYFVMHTNADGAEEELVRIYQESGSWAIQCGLNSYICMTDGMDNHRNLLLTDNIKSLMICIRRTNEKAIMLFADDGGEMAVFKKFNLNSGISIGSDTGNDVCMHSLLLTSKACEISYDGKDMVYRELSASVKTFINGKRTPQRTLVPGDLIFIYGFSIVVGKGFLAFNMIPLLEMRFGALTPMPVREKDESEVVHYFDEQSQINLFTVAPRFCKTIEEKEINVENPPQQQNDKRPAALALGPSFTMGVGSAVTAVFSVLNGLNSGREFSSVIPTLVMSGSMLMSSMIWPVVSRIYEGAHDGKKRREILSLYVKYLDSIRNQIKCLTDEQREMLCEKFPTEDELCGIAESRTVRLWERLPEHNDYLSVSLGRGNIAPKLRICNKATDPIGMTKNDVLNKECKKLLDEKPLIADAPVILSLRKNRVVGIVGERGKAVSFARGLIIQLASLHSYDLLKIVLIYDKAEETEWNFLRWLPHLWDDSNSMRFAVSGVDELKALSSGLESILNNDGSENASERDYVVICASRSLNEKSEMITHILGNKDNEHFSTIVLFDELRFLPKECDAVIELGDETVFKNADEEVRGFEFSEDSKLSEKIVLSLANTKLNSSDSKFSLPSMITFLELFGVKRIEELNCSARWTGSNPVSSLAAQIGVDTHGEILSLDLHQNVHGPHGLIAGTTGSGKSEFIMTFILSLAVNFSPREISFLLIDYKGGGMAIAFKDLPHIAGIITNLDGAAISRSIIAIESELKRRQRIFLDIGERMGSTINDIYTYQRLCREHDDIESLQHLFIISDEFAEMKKQEPEFMDKLISAARIGRSLGVHLILATQKPSGVVNAEIWSNSKFKICLKVQDREDSTEVIRRPDAAAITQTGRFYMQVGYNEIFELGQSAWCGADYMPDGGASISNEYKMISIIDNVGRVVAQTGITSRKQDSLGKQIDLITAYIAKCAQSENIKSDALWLPPIPEYICLSELEKEIDFKPNTRFEVVMGKTDIPEKQIQEVMKVSVVNGNIFLCGIEGAGKTEFLTSYIYGMLNNYSPEKSALYILDFSGETLGVFEKYNGVGAVITMPQKEKLESLFEYLDREVSKRRSKLAENAESFFEYNEKHDDMPLINVIISNYDAFKESYEEYESRVEMLSRDGQKLGIFFVITVLSSTSLKYRIMQNFSNIFAMQLADGAYSSVLGSTNGKKTSKYVGRGLMSHPEYGFVCEFQTAFIAESDVFRFVRENAAEINQKWGSRSVYRIKLLPEIYTSADAEEYCVSSEPLKVPIALDTRFSEPVYADFSQGITLILHNGAFITPIIGQIAAYILSKVRTVVLDAGGGMPPDAGYEYANGNGVYDKIVEIYDTFIGRHKKCKAAEESGQPLPDFSDDRIFVIINGYNDAENAIIALAAERGGENVQWETSEMIKRFKVMLKGSPYNCGISIMLCDKSGALRRCFNDDWFKKNITPSTFFWIGQGLSSEDHFRHEKISDRNIDFGSDLGYSVVKGKPQLVKFLNSGGND